MIKKELLTIITGIIFFICLSPAYAELYKYIDENGVVSYTDDYSLVPEAQKKSMETFKDLQSNDTILDETIVKDGSEQLVIKGEIKKSTPYKDLKILKDRLDSEKLELDKEYKTLNLEKEQLEISKQKANTRRLTRNNNKKIAEHNSRIKLYLEKREGYNKRLKEYNLKNSKK
jgi:uncharacterized protein DUF4124